MIGVDMRVGSVSCKLVLGLNCAGLAACIMVTPCIELTPSYYKPILPFLLALDLVNHHENCKSSTI